MNTIDNFNALINAHPELTAAGYGIDQSYKPGTQEYHARWASERALLFTLYPKFEHCVRWIAGNSEKIRGNRSTYFWKGQVEHDLFLSHVSDRYIPQGAFIVAALSMGYEIDRVDQGGPNVFLRAATPGLVTES